MKNFSKILIFVFMFSLIVSSSSLVADDGPNLSNLKKFNGKFGERKGEWEIVNTITDDVYDFFTRKSWERKINRVEKIIQVEKKIPEKIIPGKFIPKKTDSVHPKYIVTEIGKRKYKIEQNPIWKTKEVKGYYEVKKDKLNNPKKVWRYKKIKK